MKRKYLIVISFMLVFILSFSILSYAEGGDLEGKIISSMSGVKDATVDTENGVGKVINIVIGLLQVAGSGISIIVIVILGIRYMLASVEGKAEIKKQATPIVIGCILLFGAVNLMGAVENFATKILNN